MAPLLRLHIFIHMETIIYYLHNGDNIPFYIGKTKNKNLHRNYQHKYTYGNNTILEILNLLEILSIKMRF